MGQIVFGSTIICPNCKVRRGKTIYGKGYHLTSRARALSNGWKIITAWRTTPYKPQPYDTVKVLCGQCNGTGLVEWQTRQT